MAHNDLHQQGTRTTQALIGTVRMRGQEQLRRTDPGFVGDPVFGARTNRAQLITVSLPRMPRQPPSRTVRHSDNVRDVSVTSRPRPTRSTHSLHPKQSGSRPHTLPSPPPVVAVCTDEVEDYLCRLYRGQVRNRRRVLDTSHSACPARQLTPRYQSRAPA